MRKAQSGFTLLELMLVVTLAGLLLGLGIPAMGNFIRNARITGAANDVMAALHFTRSEAIKRRQAVTLCTSANPLDANPTCANSPLLTGWIAFVENNPNPVDFGQRDAGEAVLLQREPIPATITARASANPFRVTYLLNGFATNVAAAQLVLCDERGNVPSGGQLSAARGILVAATGRAQVTRDLGQVQTLIDDIGVAIGGCS